LTLEERVRRLEDALAVLQDTRQIETRVAQRVADRLTQVTAIPVAEGASGRVPSGKAIKPEPSAPPRPSDLLAGARRSWLLFDLIAEARIILRMYVDPRYSMTWTGRTLPLILLAAFLFSTYWVPLSGLPLIGYLVVKVVELLIAFVLFKLLFYEARRYREVSPDLPPSLRW